MQINQKLIAEKAQVSCATVSRVIRNPAIVRPQLASKVYKAMRELGVEIEGMKISSEEQNCILAVVDNFTTSLFGQLTAGIAECINQKGLTLVLCNSGGNIEVEAAAVEKACRNGYIGIIFLTAVNSEEYRNMLRNIPIPVVMLNRKLDGMDYDSVLLDHFETAKLVVRHLLMMGHKRIALLTTDVESTNTSAEKAGFISALAGSGTTYSQAESSVFYADSSYLGGGNFATEFVRQKLSFSAIYTLGSELTTGFVTKLNQLGKRIPEDISVVGLNKSPILIGSGIPITTMEQPAVEMGIKAVEVLLERAKNSERERMNILYNPTLIKSESVAKVIPFAY